MNQATLHYIYDPLCGWCYGAAPLVKAAREVLPVSAHGGGMMSGARRQPVSEQLRAYVTPHDRRIAQLTGQVFGTDYFEGLLRDTSAVFDSEPPIAAMLAAQKLAGRGLDLLTRLQTAHYVQGRRIADRDTLLELADEIGLEQGAFDRALAGIEGAVVQAHIDETRALMSAIGAAGFPTFTLEVDGGFLSVDVGAFLGRPESFAGWLRARSSKVEAARTHEPAFVCGPDECSV